MSRSGTYPCAAGCGAVNDDADAATLWMRSPFGLACLRVCKRQECARLAVEMRAADGWKLRRGNVPPFATPEDRDAFMAARGA